MNSKIKIAGLGVVVALAAAASPYVLKVEPKKETAIAAEQPSATFTAAQKTELDGLIKDYILKNPQVLMDSVNNYRSAQEKTNDDQALQSLKESSDYLYKSSSLPDVGNKKADLTIVEFFDYNCGYCKQGFESVQHGLNDDKNLRFVFVDFPILSESSHVASVYALAAHKQGKYFPLHQALMTFKGPKTEENIITLAKSVGIDTDKLKADAKDPGIEAELKKNMDLAQKLAITGTPAFIIGDQIIRGYVPYEAMKTLIADQRKKAG